MKEETKILLFQDPGVASVMELKERGSAAKSLFCCDIKDGENFPLELEEDLNLLEKVDEPAPVELRRDILKEVESVEECETPEETYEITLGDRDGVVCGENTKFIVAKPLIEPGSYQPCLHFSWKKPGELQAGDKLLCACAPGRKDLAEVVCAKKLQRLEKVFAVKVKGDMAFALSNAVFVRA